MDYEKMKRLREAAGMSQVELGEKVFVTSNMICQIERGRKKPSLSLLEAIAEALGVRTAELL